MCGGEWYENMQKLETCSKKSALCVEEGAGKLLDSSKT